MRAVVLVLVAGCGRVAFDEQHSDATCAWSSFSTPTKLPGDLNTVGGDDWYAVPAQGGLDVYIHSYRPASPGGALWHATRAALDQPFGEGVELSELYVGTADAAPAITDDALDLMFQLDGAGNDDIFETTRASTADAFGTPVQISIDTAAHEATPWLSADGLRLLFASARGAVGGIDLYEATRADRASTFTTPHELHELDTPGDDTTPSLSADALDIYWASRQGTGDFDIYTAHRIATDQPFSAPSLVRELQTPLDDVAPHLSRDGTTLYLNYDTQVIGGADADIYIATRTCD